MNIEYVKDESGEVWWCNSHQRKATYLFRERHRCDPQLGGSLLPCFCVNITDELEIIEDNDHDK